ncbi:MAG: PQQ-binding-like beta-propeller repeat protein [Gemmataceae bacterium]
MLPRNALLAALGLNLALLLPGLALLSPRPRAAGPRLLTGPMHLEWRRDEPPLEPTWPDQPRFASDVAARPVAAGSAVLLTSSRLDGVTAVDALTGSTLWRFTADGPVRFAPVTWEGRAYVVSDDGHLYCLEIATGEVLWKVRGGPSDRRVLGNERLISTWPARGAPAVAEEPDGEATVYFGAGIWPFQGVFLHALDARTGQPRWCNSGDGSTFIKQPHQTDAFAGLAPQGGLVVVGDRLLVPGGRSIPACYDRATGKRLHYRLADASKLGGGPDVVAARDVYFNGGGAFELATGEYLGTASEPLAVAGPTLYSVVGTTCRVFDLDRRPPWEPDPPPDPKAKGKAKKKDRVNENWLGQPSASFRVPRSTALLQAHGRLYGAGPGVVYAIDLPLKKGRSPLTWQAPIDGTPVHLAVTDEQLLVSTREGYVYAFGPHRVSPRRQRFRPTPLPPAPREAAALAKRILTAANVREGYAVLHDADAGLVGELTRLSGLRVVVVDPDREQVAALRAKLRRAGIDGKRVAALGVTPEEAHLPPYLASLVVCDGPCDFDAVYHSLRPYGGVACWSASAPLRDALRAWAEHRSSEDRPAVEERDGLLLLRRDGPLPGAGDWTHEHADAANTRVSRDSRVKAPLGVLWWGGPGHQGVLPRHGHGPVPQVCDGRLVIEGPDLLRAIDVYTGRLLWETTLPGVGAAYDNLAHQPGANAAGSNYVTTPGGVYVAYRDACRRLDPATGKMLDQVRLPPLPGQKLPPAWTFLTVGDGVLVGGADPVVPAPPDKKKAKGPPPAPSASRRLTVLDRATGKPRFTLTARHGFRHNGIALGGGRLYAVDLPPMVETKRGKEVIRSRAPGRLVAFDLASGRLLWSSERDVFGTWLSYSARHDVLVEAGLMSRDTLTDEPAGMRAYRGRGGEVLWFNKDYFGPALIHGDRVLKGGDARAGSGTACELLTGKPVLVPDPITGKPAEWRWVRTYGCNTPGASEHLMVFRSGAAGFYDLCGDGGTGNLGGFRSSCTLNLIPAGGVLTVPDYTRTCTCSYQNQCSVGLVHQPDAELWTFTTARPVQGVVRRLGVNLGAPGQRKAEGGTLWLDYPAVGGPAPKVAVSLAPASPETYRLHASQVEGNGTRWVGASGVRGLSRLTIDLGDDGGRPRRYTVRLYFLEPDAVAPGDRVFDVAVQGKTVLPRLDVAEQASGAPPDAGPRVPGGGRPRVTVTLAPCDGSARPRRCCPAWRWC